MLDILFLVVVPFGITIILTPILIPMLRKLKFGQSILKIGPSWHNKKQGTPTMGGIAFIVSIIIASVIYIAYAKGKPPEIYYHNPWEDGGPVVSASWKAILIILPALCFGVIGFLDDFVKVALKRNLGLRAWQKFSLQLIVGTVFAFIYKSYLGTGIVLPFTDNMFDLGYFYVPFCVFLFIGVSNAVNLTDGVDGLVSTLIPLSIFAFALLPLPIMHYYDMGFGRVYDFIIIISASVFGFLVYNKNPAKIFMGDTGSLFLGGFLASIGIIYHNPIALFLVGIIYVSETLSVIIQVIVFKLTGRRVFKMSPLHHHFEMSGWKENKIVIVFASITVVMGAISWLLFR